MSLEFHYVETHQIAAMNAKKDSDRIEIVSPRRPEQWRSFLPAMRSVFGSVEFATIVEAHLGHKAQLVTWTGESGTVVYPLFLRSSSTLSYTQAGDKEVWDSVSPEYTGPMSLGAVDLVDAVLFQQKFADYCRRQSIVAEFAHLHPWQHTPELLVRRDCSFDRKIVYIDLTVPEADLWKNSFNHACRKNIRRSQREQVSVYPAQTEADVEQFYAIYIETMDRNQAADKYRFPLQYFLDFFHTMAANAVFMMADFQGQTIAGTLYLHDADNVYSYLGGANHRFQKVRPTNAVIYETIRWAQQAGKKRLILGGGYGPDDGIFRFKSTFSPLTADFRIYRHIHDRWEYESQCSAWSRHHGVEIPRTGYFPAYRQPAPRANGANAS